jgi:hypothetical protein
MPLQFMQPLAANCLGVLAARLKVTVDCFVARSPFREVSWNFAPTCHPLSMTRRSTEPRDSHCLLRLWGRSALVGKTLKEMGYTNVRNLGGFKGWLDAGGDVEKG